MTSRSTRRRGSAPFLAAAVSYAANCALGLAVVTRVVDTRRYRWIHHALYIATCATCALALGTGWFGTRARPQRTAAWILAPAALPLAVIPYAGTRGPRHPLVALAAAPFIVAGLIRSRASDDRK